MVTVPQHDTVNPLKLQKLVAEFQELWEAAYPSAAFPNLNTDDVSLLKAGLTSPLEGRLPSNISTKDFSRRASLFLFRKALPTPRPDRVHFERYAEKLANHRDVNPEVARTMRHLIPRLFKEGWDKDWISYVSRSGPHVKSCLEAATKDGGVREALKKHGITQERYVETLCTGSGLDWIATERKCIVVPDGPKNRTVTIASCAQFYLKPLHDILYDTLCKSGFVLRGDATAESLRTFVRGETKSEREEVFVSGDYEAATDNFNAAHSQLLLLMIKKQSSHIPPELFDIAVDFLTSTVYLPHGVGAVDQLGGQLMGNLLSFPLLCLTNYLGVAHTLGIDRARALTKRGLLKINGDDIIFRCSVVEFDIWSAGVIALGLTLSRGKTIVHKRVFSLNSTFFRASAKSVVLVPVIRPASVLTFTESMGWDSMAGRIKSLTHGWSGVLRSRLLAAGIRKLRNFFTGKERVGYWGSLTANLGVKVDAGALEKCGRDVLKREYEMVCGMGLLTRREEDLPWERSWYTSSTAVLGGQPETFLSDWRGIPAHKLFGHVRDEVQTEWSQACQDSAWGLLPSGGKPEGITPSLGYWKSPSRNASKKTVVQGKPHNFHCEPVFFYIRGKNRRRSWKFAGGAGDGWQNSAVKSLLTVHTDCINPNGLPVGWRGILKKKLKKKSEMERDPGVLGKAGPKVMVPKSWLESGRQLTSRPTFEPSRGFDIVGGKAVLRRKTRFFDSLSNPLSSGSPI